MNGIIINDKTYVAIEYTDCEECCMLNKCTDGNKALCYAFEELIEGDNCFMFKELKTEENTKNIDNIK